MAGLSLVTRLAALKIGDTYNQYADSHLRRRRLDEYLQRADEAPIRRVGEAAGYLLENLEVKTVLFQDRVIALNLPLTVDLAVEDTMPAIKGATAQAQLKPAKVETGITVMVPPYIETGEKIRVDTRDGRFVERAK